MWQRLAAGLPCGKMAQPRVGAQGAEKSRSKTLSTTGALQAMRASEKPHFRLPRMHLLLAGASLALVVVTVLVLRADYQRPWKQYQRTFQDRIAPFFARGRSAQPLDQARPARGPCRPLRIEQIVLSELPLDYHFSRAPRRDRCTTCHQAIALGAWDDPGQPAVSAEAQLAVELVAQAPGAQPSPQPPAGAAPGQFPQTALEDALGLLLAEEGILDPGAPTIARVVPGSPAALAGLAAGDVIVEVNGAAATGRQQAEQLLFAAALRPQAVQLLVRRGLPHPLSSHPRLDLYVSPTSPHPAERFGCTICHGGQGAATDFVGAAHTPNDPQQQARWRQEYGWLREHDWPEPMLARRFAQSGCMQCHHEPLELKLLDAQAGDPHLQPISRRDSGPVAGQLSPAVRETADARRRSLPPNERRRQLSPAVRETGEVVDVVAGYRLVRTYGCFACHEIRGYDIAGRRVGPDMRPGPDVPVEPEIRPRPDVPVGPDMRPGLEMRAEPDRASRAGQALAEPGSAAGELRKVGPSLRDLASRVDAAYVIDRLRDPRAFLPETRMPRQYGLHEHLDPQSRALAQRLEAVEIRAVAEYLLAASQALEGRETRAPVSLEDSLEQASGPTALAGASVERGKRLFALRGCLACHQHRDFPDGGGRLGPDLSHLAAKYATPAAQQWLLQWLRDPARQRPRSVMPRVAIDPLPNQEQPPGTTRLPRGQQAAHPAAGNAPPQPALLPAHVAASNAPQPTGLAPADPAADIAAYLLASARGASWCAPEPAPLVERELDDLVARYLGRHFPPEKAERFAREGIPPELAGELAAGEAVLLAPAGVREKLRYVGRCSIARRGCVGCHEIPGFEFARPIGPELSTWGRKREEELAFEQVAQWLQRAEPGSEVPDGFYMQAVIEGRREGFAWQKLRAPRSFDYRVAARKDYLDWLTMGQFELAPAEREQIVAFLLSLGAQPPPEAYVFEGTPSQQALVAGGELIERFACAECHTLRMERWTLALLPGAIGPAPELPDYDFLAPRVAPAQRAASLKTDHRGLRRAVVVGSPRVDAAGRMVADEDAGGHPLYYFTLWQPAVIDGRIWPAGGADLMVSGPQLHRREPPLGGRLARWLYPVVLARLRASGLAAADSTAWGSLPPPLAHEGAKVHAEWLEQYLLDPQPIHPAAVMRMPRFNFTAPEARRLAEYFAALAMAESTAAPWLAGDMDLAAQVAALRPPDGGGQNHMRLARMEQALRVLIDRKTYCAKCHVIGDYRPGGEVPTIAAPDLTAVSRRLRPEYLYCWLSRPQAVLPYTAMPVNFPPEGGPLDPSVFPGTSREQLDAVADLLLNYEWYLKQQTSIRRLMGQGR